MRRCTLLLTAKNSSPPVFPDVDGSDNVAAKAALRGLGNARVLRSRLSSGIVAEAVARMPQPCRVVVSGPGGFNAAALEMLARLVPTGQITVLSA